MLLKECLNEECGDKRRSVFVAGGQSDAAKQEQNGF